MLPGIKKLTILLCASKDLGGGSRLAQMDIIGNCTCRYIIASRHVALEKKILRGEQRKCAGRDEIGCD